MIQWETTERGYCRGEFTDAYGAAASIQKSSWATNDAIWLGLNEGTHHHATGECMARMHLTRDQAAELWPLLKAFAETGNLTPPDPSGYPPYPNVDFSPRYPVETHE